MTRMPVLIEGMYAIMKKRNKPQKEDVLFYYQMQYF